MELVSPSGKYKESFISGLHELIKESIHPEFLQKQADDFDTYLSQFSSNNDGEPIAVGKVTYSEYWLVDEGHYIGTLQIRHLASGRDEKIKSHIYFHIIPSKRGQGYGMQILELGLGRVKALGLKEIIIVCDKTNIPSQKIIEKNGGIFLEEILLTSENKTMLKYAIKIK